MGIRAYVPLPDWEQNSAVLRRLEVYLRRRAGRLCVPQRPGAAPHAHLRGTQRIQYRAPGLRSAAPVPSEPSARPSRQQARRFGARSAKSISSACGPTSRPGRIRRLCASAKSGSSRCLRKASSGTRCGASVYAAVAGQHGGLPDRRRPESEAPAAEMRLGPQTVS